MGIGHYAVSRHSGDSDGFKIPGPGGPQPNRHDHLVLFKEHGNEVEFTHTSEVSTVEVIGGKDKGPRIVSITPPKALAGSTKLSQIAGSLTKVVDPLYPSRHFARPVVALAAIDFIRIVDDDPAIARSIYRSLFYGLPLSVRARFVRGHPSLFAKERITNYVQPAEALLDFVEEEVAAPLRALEMLTQAFPSDVEGVSGLEELVLDSDSELGLSGATRHGVPLGRTAQSAARYLDRNTLFGPDGGFVDECRAQLAEVRQQELGESWTDPIF